MIRCSVRDLSLNKVILPGVMRGRKGGSCAQFTTIKDGKSRITIITFRVSQFTKNNIVNEEQKKNCESLHELHGLGARN